MPVRYSLSSVWERLSIFSQVSIIRYMGLCVFSLPISLVMIERIYTLSYYHHQIGSMSYYPLFRVRSWNNGIRCMSLYTLTHSASCYVSWLKVWRGYDFLTNESCWYLMWLPRVRSRIHQIGWGFPGAKWVNTYRTILGKYLSKTSDHVYIWNMSPPRG